MKRILTQDEETVIRKCHHDFEGLELKIAATQMGCSIHKIRGLLKSSERKAPHMFPIITPRQRVIIELYDQHISRATIMTILNIGHTLLGKEVTFLREHKLLWNRTPAQYQSWMEESVTETF